MFYTESRELVCRTCQDIEDEHGTSVPLRTLRALGFLFRIKPQRQPSGLLRSQLEALIAHDRALRGDCHA